MPTGFDMKRTEYGVRNTALTVLLDEVVLGVLRAGITA